MPNCLCSIPLLRIEKDAFSLGGYIEDVQKAEKALPNAEAAKVNEQKAKAAAEEF